MNKDYYQILGVSKDASDADIKSAYRKLAMKHHPDRNPNDPTAKDKFAEISEAYEVLSNKEKRQQYDAFGTVGNNGSHISDDDLFEMFRQHMHGFEHFNESFHHKRQTQDPKAPRDGKHVRIRASFDLTDILYGTSKEFTIHIQNPCQHCFGTGAKDAELTTCKSCGGSGMKQIVNGRSIFMTTCTECNGTGMAAAEKCNHCHGSGSINEPQNVKIDIPKGIRLGEQMRIPGCGMKGINGGKQGDLFIVVDYNPHDIFEYKGDLDLVTKVIITPIKAIIGGSETVQTPWGEATVNIKPGAKHGDVFRLNGCGIRTNSSQGSLYVVLNIETLTNVSKEQIELLESLDKTLTANNHPEKTDWNTKCSKFNNDTKKNHK